jgi:hypothetical protein
MSQPETTSALADLNEDWETEAYEHGLERARLDTARVADYYDPRFGEDSRRSRRIRAKRSA